MTGAASGAKPRPATSRFSAIRSRPLRSRRYRGWPSEFAGSNKATYVAWGVGEDLEKIAADLKGKGVTFEHYDNLPETSLEGDIHVMGELKAVWFKDPDGNILNLVNMM